MRPVSGRLGNDMAAPVRPRARPSRRLAPTRRPASSGLERFLSGLTAGTRSLMQVAGGFSAQRLGFAATTALFVATGVYGVFLGGHAADFKDGALERLSGTLRDSGFRVSEVRITGARLLTTPELFERIGLNKPVTTIGYNVEEARRRLIEIPWIKSATVRVLLPGILDVALVERAPFALWQKGGQINLVDREGGVIGPYDDERFSNLPVVVGDGAEKRVFEIRELLEQHPDLRQKVRAAVLVAERRWTLKLADGVDVMLPEEGAREALDTLSRIDENSKLLNRDISIVDLRIANRVVVRLTERAAQLRADTLKTRSRQPASQQGPTAAKQPARTI